MGATARLVRDADGDTTWAPGPDAETAEPDLEVDDQEDGAGFALSTIRRLDVSDVTLVWDDATASTAGEVALSAPGRRCRTPSRYARPSTASRTMRPSAHRSN